MKKILGLVLLVVVALVGCKQGNKVDPNAPLELTVENLAGKWVLESDSNTWYEFTADSKYTSKIDGVDSEGELTIENGKVQLWIEISSDWKGSLLAVELFKTYCIIENTTKNTAKQKFIKQ